MVFTADSLSYLLTRDYTNLLSGRQPVYRPPEATSLPFLQPFCSPSTPLYTPLHPSACNPLTAPFFAFAMSTSLELSPLYQNCDRVRLAYHAALPPTQTHWGPSVSCTLWRTK